MNTLVIFTFVLIALSSCEFNEENFIAQLNLIDMDLEDECSDISASTHNYLLKSPSYIKERIKLLEDHGKYLRRRSEHLKKFFESESDYPTDYERNLTLLLKNGDTLLPSEQYNKLVHFYLAFEDQDINLNVPCSADKQNCTLYLSDVENILETSRNITLLEETWNVWNDNFSNGASNFKDILSLVKNASTANGYYDAKKYWEALVEVEDGYEKATNLWTEIEPLYKKLQDFVLVRLNKYYNSNFTEIPYYLLGNLQGNDWTNIADIILPHPQLLYDINIELNALPNSVNLYKLAENATKGMGLGKLGQKFWSKSNFNQKNCEPKILEFCSFKYSEVITCNQTKFTNYLKAHEAAFEITLNNQDYGSLPRQKMRYSILNDAIKELGGIIGIANTPFNNLLHWETFKNDQEDKTKNKMTALLLTALRTLPKLPYYLMVDLFRLEELENPSSNITESWWKFKTKYQNLKQPDILPNDFLNDKFIISNKPYLSKFFAVILQFQLISYYQISIFEDDNNIQQHFKDDESFKTMIRDRPNKNVLDLLTYNYGVNEISSYDILYYLEPLNSYFGDAPIEQRKIRTHTARNMVLTTPKPKIRTRMPSKKQILAVTTTPVPEIVKKEIKKPEEKPKIEQEAAPISEQKRNSYIFIGVACGLIVLAALYGIFVKCRKKLKIKRNNRRFEA